MAGFQVIHDDEWVKISVDDRGADVTVYSFGGVGGQSGGFQWEEFRRTTESFACNVVFFIDKTRQWYSRPEVSGPIDAILAKRPPGRRIFLGNSMGGYGALCYATAHQPDVAIAFSPQMFCHPDMLRAHKMKWLAYMEGATDIRYPECPPLTGPTHYHLFYGLNDRREWPHYRAAKALLNENVSIWRHYLLGHDLVGSYKAAGVLDTAILACMTGAEPSLKMRLAAEIGRVISIMRALRGKVRE